MKLGRHVTYILSHIIHRRRKKSFCSCM